MADVKNWLAGFVWRGRAPWETAEPAYHVELGEFIEIPGRDPVNLGTKTLTPEAAEAAGFPIAGVVGDINAAVMADRDAARRLLAETQAEAARLGSLSQALAAQVEGALAALAEAEEARDAFRGTVSTLETERSALTERVGKFDAERAALLERIATLEAAGRSVAEASPAA